MNQPNPSVERTCNGGARWFALHALAAPSHAAHVKRYVSWGNGVPENEPLSASVVWIDRETYAYVVGGEKVLVWVDYEPGLFSRGRVIHSESIDSWVSSNGDAVRLVSEQERATIVEAISAHLQANKSKVRVVR
jgi:hypothetical protein